MIHFKQFQGQTKQICDHLVPQHMPLGKSHLTKLCPQTWLISISPHHTAQQNCSQHDEFHRKKNRLTIYCKVCPLPVISGVITPISRVITSFITCFWTHRASPVLWTRIYVQLRTIGDGRLRQKVLLRTEFSQEMNLAFCK